MVAEPSQDWSVFKQIFADHWEAFQHAHPRYQTSYYDGLVAKMLACGNPEKMGYVEYRCLHCGQGKHVSWLQPDRAEVDRRHLGPDDTPPEQGSLRPGSGHGIGPHEEDGWVGRTLRVGDAVLRGVAKIAQKCARETDAVARYGGEEMALILPETDAGGARAVAERIRQAVEAAQHVHRHAVEIGDAQAAGISLGFWAKAADGELRPELVRAALEQDSGDVHTGAEVLQADALVRLHAGEQAGAVAVLERAEKLVRDAGLRQEYVAPVYPWLATALRLAYCPEPQLARQSRRSLLRRPNRAAPPAHPVARSYRNNLPPALRERGLIAALGGRPVRARRCLVFRRCGLWLGNRLGCQPSSAARPSFIPDISTVFWPAYRTPTSVSGRRFTPRRS